MDVIDETRRVAITSPGASAFLDASARYHLMNPGVFALAIARRLGVSVFPSQAICSACDAPMDSRGDHASLFCGSGPVSRGHRHGSLMHALSGTLHDANLRSEREKGGLFPDTKRGHLTTTGLHVASPDACERDGTDWMAAAFDVTVVSCYTETRERSLLLTASERAAGHAAKLAESRRTSAFLNREADIQELLRMHDDAPWERSFQFRPFAVDVVGAYGGVTTSILQQLARKRSEHTSIRGRV
jgi:hypothetical protein